MSPWWPLLGLLSLHSTSGTEMANTPAALFLCSPVGFHHKWDSVHSIFISICPWATEVPLLMSVSQSSWWKASSYCCHQGIRTQDLVPPTYSGYCFYSRVLHYGDVIMSVVASQIMSLTTVCSTVYSGADKRKHQSSVSLAFVRGIHRWMVNSPHNGPVMQKMFSFHAVIMVLSL